MSVQRIGSLDCFAPVSDEDMRAHMMNTDHCKLTIMLSNGETCEYVLNAVTAAAVCEALGDAGTAQTIGFNDVLNAYHAIVKSGVMAFGAVTFGSIKQNRDILQQLQEEAKMKAMEEAKQQAIAQLAEMGITEDDPRYDQAMAQFGGVNVLDKGSLN